MPGTFWRLQDTAMNVRCLLKISGVPRRDRVWKHILQVQEGAGAEEGRSGVCSESQVVFDRRDPV